MIGEARDQKVPAKVRRRERWARVGWDAQFHSSVVMVTTAHCPQFPSLWRRQDDILAKMCKKFWGKAMQVEILLSSSKEQTMAYRRKNPRKPSSLFHYIFSDFWQRYILAKNTDSYRKRWWPWREIQILRVSGGTRSKGAEKGERGGEESLGWLGRSVPQFSGYGYHCPLPLNFRRFGEDKMIFWRKCIRNFGGRQYKLKFC